MNKINVNTVFSNEEIDMMNYYVEQYVTEKGHTPAENRAPITEVLDKAWATEKYPLYKAFGEQLILRKEVSITMPASEIHQEISNLTELRTLRDKMREIAPTVDPALCWDNFYGRRVNTVEIALEYLVEDSWALAENKYGYSDSIECLMPKGPSLKLERGVKAVRFIGKVAEAYGFKEEFEAFRLAHSRILNTAKLKGTLCLSIHPLDYMTMSDNASGWQSCMSWRQRGCYRGGTVEMMNSPRVVVAYLESSTQMPIGNYNKWNNKKWRVLIVVDNDYITTVKDYPYHQEELCLLSTNWLVDIANAAGANFSKAKMYLNDGDEGPFYIPDTDEELDIIYTTDVMYNDFCSDYPHALAIASKENRYKEIHYSGCSQCMWCGAIKFVNGYDEEQCAPEYLVCRNCGAPDTRCHECGSWTYSSNTYDVQGYEICQYCYEHRTAIEFYTQEREFRHNLRKVYVIKDGENPSEETSYIWANSCKMGWAYIYPYVARYNRGWHSFLYIREADLAEAISDTIKIYIHPAAQPSLFE